MVAAKGVNTSLVALGACTIAMAFTFAILFVALYIVHDGFAMLDMGMIVGSVIVGSSLSAASF